jgi:PAS domain S-box-containing protein
LDGAEGYAVVLLDPGGLVKTWSGGAQRLLGYPENEIVGRSFAAFFTPADCAARVPEAVLERARTSGGAQSEGRRLRADGTEFWAYGVLTPIRNRAGVVTSFVGVIHDVSARYEAERAVEELNAQLVRVNEELEQRVAERTALLEARTAELISANNELEAFSYSVSHDLRAPVRAVQGFARIVGDRYRELLPAEGRAQLERIAAGAQRMGALVDSLLRLSRMQRQPMVTSVVDMTRVVERCWAELDEQYVGHLVELVLSPLPAAEGDPQLLQQVWMNLLDNAIKYSGGSPGARVEVSSRPRDDEVVYEVRDNGAGFDQRYADKLFRAFQRLHGDDEFTGIGIGLAIVQRVILRHGGEVWASGQPGAGATFSFSLRRADDPAA